MKTKIYEIKLNDARFWVCANTAIEAIKTYLSTTDNYVFDLEDEDDIHEIPQESWGNYTLVDTEAEMDEEGNYPVIMTFADYMEKQAMDADIIATTAY